MLSDVILFSVQTMECSEKGSMCRFIYLFFLAFLVSSSNFDSLSENLNYNALYCMELTCLSFRILLPIRK